MYTLVDEASEVSLARSISDIILSIVELFCIATISKAFQNSFSKDIEVRCFLIVIDFLISILD